MNTNIFSFLNTQNNTTPNITKPKTNNSIPNENSLISAFNEIMNNIGEESDNTINQDSEYINIQDSEYINIQDNVSYTDSITPINSTTNTPDKDKDSNNDNEEDNKASYIENNIETFNSSQFIVNTEDFNSQKNLQIGVNNEDDLKYSLEHNNKTITNKLDINKIQNLNESQNLDFENNMLIEDDKENYDLGINDSEFKIYDDSLLSTNSAFEDELVKASESEELAKDILNQIDSGIKTSSTPRNINIMLKPQQLGNVNLKIKFLPTGMHIEIIVDNDVTQDAIMNNLSKLEHIISPNNDLNIASINISQRKEIQIKEQQAKEYSLELKKQENLINSKRVNPIFYKKNK